MPSLNKDDVLRAMDGHWAEFYGQSTTLRAHGGEMRGRCPLHGGHGPNFAVDPRTGLWNCHSKCGVGGDGFQFLMLRDGLTFPEAVQRVGDWAGVRAADPPCGGPRPARRDMAAREPSTAAAALDAILADAAHETLRASLDWPRWLAEHRGLSQQTITDYNLGLVVQREKDGKEYGRITFPVYDKQERLVNIRRHLFAYRPNLTDEKRRELGKTMPWAARLPTLLYPLSRLEGAGEVLIVEGEADALLANQLGIAAVTGTLGAGNWKDEWTAALRGKAVVLLLDNDEADKTIGYAPDDTVGSLRPVQRLVRPQPGKPADCSYLAIR